ncbi:hypothetical protein D3C76_1351010 [compost metagenome]
MLLNFDGVSQIRSFFASSAFTLAKVASALGMRSSIWLYDTSDTPVYSHIRSSWPVSWAWRAILLPRPVVTRTS